MEQDELQPAADGEWPWVAADIAERREAEGATLPQTPSADVLVTCILGSEGTSRTT